jgi:alcohol dehydrogenase
VDDPTIIDPSDIVVRIDTSTICGTDLHKALKGLARGQRARSRLGRSRRGRIRMIPVRGLRAAIDMPCQQETI